MPDFPRNRKKRKDQLSGGQRKFGKQQEYKGKAFIVTVCVKEFLRKWKSISALSEVLKGGLRDLKGQSLVNILDLVAIPNKLLN